MKIQCDVCEKAEATVLCCADEAALCWACDEKVHAANKLAEKHQRVPLLLPNTSNSTNTPSSSQLPTCDICQEKAGYFFCLEDRALLCRHCDVGIHTASPYGPSHQRFLVTGVRVALQHYLTNNSNTNSTNNDRSNSSSSNGNSSNPLVSQASEASIADKKMSGSKLGFDVPEVQGLKAEWSWREVFAKSEFDLCFGISEPGSSS